MSDSNKIAIAGLIITAALGILNTVVALFINKRTIQAALELAQPAAKLRARTRKRRKRHPLRVLVKVQRLEQFMSILVALFVTTQTYDVFQAPSVDRTLWWIAITFQTVLVLNCAFSVVMSQKIINTIRKKIRPAARKLKHEGTLFSQPSKADSRPTHDT